MLQWGIAVRNFPSISPIFSQIFLISAFFLSFHSFFLRGDSQYRNFFLAGVQIFLLFLLFFPSQKVLDIKMSRSPFLNQKCQVFQKNQPSNVGFQKKIRRPLCPADRKLFQVLEEKWPQHSAISLRSCILIAIQPTLIAGQFVAPTQTGRFHCNILPICKGLC